MQQQVLPFVYESNVLRVELGQDGEPLFHAGDLCAILAYSNPRDAVARHVEEDDVVKRDAIDTLGRTQQVNYVREPGLWSLVLGSHAPNAKPIKRWVTAEVLPSIRKTGGYRMGGAKRPALGVNSLLSLQNQMLRLLKDIRAEACPAVRAALHGSLAAVCGALEVPAPTLDDIAPAATEPANPEAARAAWRLYELLDGDATLNHSGASRTIAINLPELAARAAKEGLPLPPLNELRQALKLSEQPQFVGHKVVHSVRNRRRKSGPKSVKCMVFAMRPSPQAKPR